MRLHLRAALLLSAVPFFAGARAVLADATVVSRLTVTTQVPPELAEQAKTNSGAPAKNGTETRTLRTYYKGTRQRLEVSQGKEVVINDLAANKRITLSPATKTYYVVPLAEKKPAPPSPTNPTADPTEESFKSAVTLAADLQPGSGARTIAGKSATSYAYNVSFGLDMNKVMATVKEEMAKQKEKADREKPAAGEKPAAEAEEAAGSAKDTKKDDSDPTEFVTAMLALIPSISMKVDGEQWVTDAVNLPVRWVSPTLFGAGAITASSPLEETPLPPSVPVDLKEFMTKLSAIRGFPLSGRASFDITIRFSDQAVSLAKSQNRDKKNQLPEGPINVRFSLANEVQSIREAPLSDSLFVVPKGYRKVAAPTKRGGLPGFPSTVL
jgi:hypothetical protein